MLQLAGNRDPVRPGPPFPSLFEARDPSIRVHEHSLGAAQDRLFILLRHPVQYRVVAVAVDIGATATVLETKDPGFTVLPDLSTSQFSDASGVVARERWAEDPLTYMVSREDDNMSKKTLWRAPTIRKHALYTLRTGATAHSVANDNYQLLFPSLQRSPHL